ncbi:MAG: hypothetical protein JRJ16_18645 [Deltaproteobacteria bacterium]|nr:hypothetical protein [Deltaproteobacteria bacterium]
MEVKQEVWEMDRGDMEVTRKRRHLTAEEKFQIFLEANAAKAKEGGSVSGVLRRWGIHSSDLARIRKGVEEGAIALFKEKKSRRPKVDYDEHERVLAEKRRLERTVIEQAAELALLKKKDPSGWTET